MDLHVVRRKPLRDAAVAAGLIPLTLVLVVVLLSVALLPEATWTVRTILAGFCILAVARPADALLVTASLIGFGIIISHLVGIPLLRVADVLVAASLLGCCVRALPNGSPFRLALTRSVSAPIALLAMTAVASTLVWLRVYQIQSGSLSAYGRTFVQFVTRDYFVAPGEFSVVVSTVAILQGLALFVVMRACCRMDSNFFSRGLHMLTIGGAAVAVMSIVRLAEILVRNPTVVDELRKTSAGLRISPQIPDYIAAGSYFSLCWLAALGLAIASARHRLVWTLVSAPLIAGLYLTGSRSVIAAALAGVIVLTFASVFRQRAVAFRGVIAVAIIAVVAMIGSFRWMIGHDIAGETARASLLVRGELLRTGYRVIATRPVFGVGIDRFYRVAGMVTSPVLDSLWPGRRNPHNDFLRFAGELGLIGLGLFVWILCSAGIRLWKTLKSHADPGLAGLAAGLVAFLVTSLVSNPLMLRDVSYVFWIALGLAVGRCATLEADGGAAFPSATSSGGRSRLWRASAPWVLAIVLFGSVPFRARQELATLDPGGVSAGLSDWETASDGMRFRWSRPQVTVYVSGRARRVEIPLRGTLPSGGPQHVEVRLDGRLVNDITVGSDWQRLGVVLPLPDPTKSRRIDLSVSPTWERGDTVAGSNDRAIVGVQVGELTVIR